MTYITPAQATAQRLITAPTFTDTCQRLTHTPTDGDYGTGTGQATYPESVAFACSFQGKPVRDAQEATAVPMADADLYYAIGTTLLSGDRVTITHLLGVAVASPQSYKIVGGPLVLHNVMHAELSLVTDGS